MRIARKGPRVRAGARVAMTGGMWLWTSELSERLASQVNESAQSRTRAEVNNPPLVPLFVSENTPLRPDLNPASVTIPRWFWGGRKNAYRRRVPTTW